MELTGRHNTSRSCLQIANKIVYTLLFCSASWRSTCLTNEYSFSWAGFGKLFEGISIGKDSCSFSWMPYPTNLFSTVDRHLRRLGGVFSVGRLHSWVVLDRSEKCVNRASSQECCARKILSPTGAYSCFMPTKGQGILNDFRRAWR